MLVAGPAGCFHAAFQHFLRFRRAPGALQRLRGHEVAIRVIRMEFQKSLKLGQRLFRLSSVGILHGKSIASKGIARVVFQELGKHLKPARIRHKGNLPQQYSKWSVAIHWQGAIVNALLRFQNEPELPPGFPQMCTDELIFTPPAGRATIAESWLARSFFLPRESPLAGLFPPVCLWALALPAPAGLERKRSLPQTMICAISATLVMPVAAAACRRNGTRMGSVLRWPGMRNPGLCCIT